MSTMTKEIKQGERERNSNEVEMAAVL